VCAKWTYYYHYNIFAFFFFCIFCSSGNFNRRLQPYNRSRVISFHFFCFVFFSFLDLSERQICWRCGGGSKRPPWTLSGDISSHTYIYILYRRSRADTRIPRETRRRAPRAQLLCPSYYYYYYYYYASYAFFKGE